MRIRFTIILLSIISLLPCSCSNSGNGGSFSSSLKTDTLQYARGFEIEYCEDYTRISLRNPWDTLNVKRRYLLVDREHPLPASLPEGTVVRVPVRRAVVYASVHAALMEQIGCIDNICAVCEPEYITSGKILKRISEGSICDAGKSTSPDVETIVNCNAEIIIASPFENSGYGSAEKIGIPIIEAADYMEGHPLGRCEWIKFFGLLFDRTDVADSLFSETCIHYQELAASAAQARPRPSVILERKYGSSWFVPSGNSYIGILHKDAGADYVFRESEGSGSIPYSFETVLDKGENADFWLFKYDAPAPYSYRDLEKEYNPYNCFKAFRQKHIFACNTLRTHYYDDITLHPDWILEDLINIYHPELIEGYQPRYYFPLQ